MIDTKQAKMHMILMPSKRRKRLSKSSSHKAGCCTVTWKQENQQSLWLWDIMKMEILLQLLILVLAFFWDAGWHTVDKVLCLRKKLEKALNTIGDLRSMKMPSLDNSGSYQANSISLWPSHGLNFTVSISQRGKWSGSLCANLIYATTFLIVAWIIIA